MKVAVVTSGGDAPGMNAAVRGVVRRGLERGCEMLTVREGYSGLIGGWFEPCTWTAMSRIQHLGGTVLGTARSDAFRTTEGRAKVVENLVNAGVSRLVVVGGDGSLTGACLLRDEWANHLETLVGEGLITANAAAAHPVLGLAGLIGSIDNDLVGSDRTIGCDTALHRIVDAVDTLTSTASSHQRSFVVEVMGRHCGFLALASSVCTGSDEVLVPERPTENWQLDLFASVREGRKLGKRKSIILIAEGARDGEGKPIDAALVKTLLERELELDTRITVLGHVQRGGSPSAYDRFQSTLLGVAAADAVIDRAPEAEPQVFGTAGPHVVALSMLQSVKTTRALDGAVGERAHDVLDARGPEFEELLRAHDVMASPLGALARGKRLLLLHLGAPAPGMNAAVRAFVRHTLDAGHTPHLAHDGVEGLLAGKVAQAEWMTVNGIAAYGATILGTNRTLPRTDKAWAALEEVLNTYDGVVVVGGFAALELAARVRVPLVVVPATISNNVPGTETSIGTDTAMNAICEAVDRLKQSAIGSRNRVFFVEVMGSQCGFLARASGVAAGAELVYTDEEPITLARLEADVQGLNRAMDEGRSVGLVLVADGVPSAFRASRLADLFKEASEGRFDTRVCVLGHLQQGGSPSPADRLLAVRLAQRAVDVVQTIDAPVVVGVERGQVCVRPILDVLGEADRVARRPREPRQWLPRTS